MRSAKSTLHRGGEGQNARRAQFSNTYGQGCSLIACLELDVALYNLYAIAQIVCFPKKITTQEGGNRERR